MTRSGGLTKWRTRVGWLMASFALAAMATTSARADVSVKQVDDAVDKGVAHLLSLQKPDGSWENGAPAKAVAKGREDHYLGGETAIATYALLAAGQKPSNPQIKKAIEWLQTHEIHGTYAIGLRSQVWHLIPDVSRTKEEMIARDKDRDWVVAARLHSGAEQGFYGYVYGEKGKPIDPAGPPSNSRTDRSNSQYGVLGAWALEQAGAEIPQAYWQQIDTAWKKSQSPTGGWTYRDKDDELGQITPTMTAAGIATLFITQDELMKTDMHRFDTCHGGTTNTNIEKGLGWMDKHFTAAIAKPGAQHYYLLYGIERIGVASGRKYFGTIDWYKNGAEMIVKTQAANGSWGPVHNTCFALLFLVRGRAPVMMNKVIYTTESKRQVDPWNERPRDLANLSRWMGDHALDNTILNWQMVNLQVSVDELHDAPILYLAGSEDLSLSDADVDKLRQFVQQGGMILGNADCASRAFSQSFWKLGHKMFPKYESRKLPLSHPIYDEMFKATKWTTHPVVEGLSNGVRELMLLVPEADLGRAWQADSTKIRLESFQLAGNIFLYATGKENLFNKGDTFIVHAGKAAGPEIKVARLAIGENFDPEPGAWPRLSAFMQNSRHVEIKADIVKLDSAALAGYKIAALTGTTKFTLSDAQRQELKDFADKGGTLIVDAAGGSGDFATAAEIELTKIFGDAGTKGLAEPLPPTFAIYADPAGKIERVGYRSYARHLMTGSAREGRIRGIEVAGKRIGVFYSREDLTAGCVGQQVDGIVGYTPEVATQLMANMIMYATKPPAAPSTRPTASAK